MIDGKRRHDVKETLDIALGFVGFFALAFLVITFVEDVTGSGSALVYSLTTIVLLGVEAALWLLRRRVLHRPEPTDEP